MNLPYTLFADISDQISHIEADSIVSKTVFDDAQAKVILFGFAPGQSLSEHTASKAAILHFLEGEATLTLGADESAVNAGAWVHMEPQLPHSITAQTEVKMLLILLK